MKKKIILIILLSIIVIIQTIFLIKNNPKTITQSNQRDEKVLQIEVINDYIKIRDNPSFKSNILGQVKKGEIYTVIDKKEAETTEEESQYYWYEIKTENNIQGYIAGKYEDTDYVKELLPQEENTDSKIDE